MEENNNVNGTIPVLVPSSVMTASKALVDPRLLKPGLINDLNMLARLFEAGFTHEEIASYFGVSREAVTKKIGRMDLHREASNPALFQEKMQEEILMRMENLLKYMSPDKMNKASLSQIIIAFGTLYDKFRLSRGESTQNVASVNVHKLAGADIQSIRDIIAKHTVEKLNRVKLEHSTDSKT